MSSPLINILIRTHRPERFKDAENSVMNAGYIPIVTHIYEDSKYQGDRSILYFYNTYCNSLVKKVVDGWFLFLDDDDTIIPGSLTKISEYLTDPNRPVICQMLREGRPKPADIYMDKRAVVKGRIGMPCLILHCKHKDMFEFPATEDADYQWIKTVSENLNCKFVKIPVVDAGRRSHGI